MAKEFYDWVKLALDNKWLIMLCFGSVTSLVTNATQLVNNSDLEAETIASQQQIATIANYYAKPKEKPVKAITKIYKTDCGMCTVLMNNHKIEFH